MKRTKSGGKPPHSRCFALIAVALLLAGCEANQPPEARGIPVRMETAARRDFAPTLTLLGVVRAAQSVPLTAQQRGSVSYPPRFAGGLRTGERVTRGEVLAI